MTNEQIERAAETHADELKVSSAIPGALLPMLYDIAKTSYICGAQDALASQWISVDEYLPENDDNVIVFVPAEPAFCLPDRCKIAYHDGEDWYTTDGEHIRPTRWMEIPKYKNEKEGK